MIYSSDIKAFARVWREYDQAVRSMNSQCYWEYLDGDRWCGVPCIGSSVLHQEWLPEILPAGHTKPASIRERDLIYQGKFTYPELVDMFGTYMPQQVIFSDQVTHYDLWRIRNPELVALNSMTNAADLWADMLLPLKNVGAYSVPISCYESGLQELRSAVYSYTKQVEGETEVKIAWTHECTAPTELLRLMSEEHDELDDAQQRLVLTAIAGWLSTKIKLRTSTSDLTEPDLIANLCLAIASCPLLPPVVRHEDLGDEQDDTINCSTIEISQIISQTHSPHFEEWCQEFYDNSVRQHENASRRQDNQNCHYGLPGDIETTSLSIDESCFVSHLNPSSIFETRNDVQMLTRGLSLEERTILDLYAEGYTSREIAERFRLPQSTIKARIFRIKEKALTDSRKFNISY